MSLLEDGVEHFTEDDISIKSTSKKNPLAETMEIEVESSDDETPTPDEIKFLEVIEELKKQKPVFISNYFMQQMFNAWMNENAFELFKKL